ncbi:type II secretion system F family protein [Candidatus Woesearchaeota archaeon]|nr:type II secretion system F family protein [Candidatus Woesearchaeota archaeon]
MRIAHLPYTPRQFIKSKLKLSVLYSFLFSFLLLFVFQKAGLSLILALPAFIIVFVLFFEYFILSVKAKIRKREREVNKEVLFVGRYLLVKLYSGRPLLNALIETAEGRGIASKYIKEIVDDIGTGNTIEDALNSAMIYSPSDKLRSILFHINNALQLGIDVTKPLESVLEEITKEEELEIKKYGKKLNTLVIFYMLGAVILPSLGVALFIIISSLVNLSIGWNDLLIFTLFLVVLQFLFITFFRSIRPMVNL